LRTRAKASAPAKVILLGEHFVVHGAPALALAIDKRATATADFRADSKIFIKSRAMKASGYFEGDRFHVEEGAEESKKRLEPIHAVAKSLLGRSGKHLGVNIEIDSSIPVAAGLGSSAAVAVASTTALDYLLEIGLSRDEVFETAFNAEKIVHGTPSGIDPAIAIYGGVIQYAKGGRIEPLDVKIDLPLVVGDTRKERSTGEMVARVNDLRRRYPSIVGSMIEACGKIVTRSIEALRSGDLKTLGEMMDMDHALLYAVGVSCEPLERLVHAARRAGALGAKLTGAGGGGCMIALTAPEKLKDVAEAIEKEGGEAFITNKTMDGVRIEE